MAKRGRKPKRRLKELYGDYKGLLVEQVKYIKIMADPETELKGLTQKDIANIVGVKSRKTLYSWANLPEIRDAILAEKQRKLVDKYPSMLQVLEDIAYSRTPGTTPTAVIKAATVWLKAGGYFKKAGEATADEITEKEKSLEKRLMELRNAKRSRGDTS